jgi:alpha-amylase/alpha-mannosidase (GH57 family)
MRPVSLAILWHQHQPYYPDDLTGEVLMPWVRFHATKDYIGMALHLQEVPEFRCSINLVPSLLVQIQRYVDGGSDRHLDVSRMPVDGLSHHDARYLVDNFFAANQESMIRPFPRYLELHRKRSTQPASSDAALSRMTQADLRDLQVWHNLSWFHEILFEQDAELKEFRDKGSDYTEDEKHWLLAKQREVIARVIPLHKELQDRGQVELTTTPFYHPILPLLWDKRSARQGMPNCQLPESLESYAEDAVRHLQSAVALHEKFFGCKPRGMWPSEGSVSQEILPAIMEAGIQWIATDEGILSRSLDNAIHRDHHKRINRPDLLYRPWKWEHQGQTLSLIFRDLGLSDFIGFEAQRQDPVSAAHHLLNACAEIGRAIRRDKHDAPVLVPIVLDGENCWEHYRDGGVVFLRTLYREAVRHSDVNPVRICDHLESSPAPEKLSKLHAGSWINSDFYIWIGHEEDRQAWDLLHLTRDFLKKQATSGRFKEATITQAWRELDIAEGSDWCWWYGDDRSSGQDELFDQLFRRHLQNVYKLLSESPPAALLRPICRICKASIHTQPRRLLHVRPDGRRRYFEWKSAGTFIAGSERGTMARVTQGPIRELHFGFDQQTLLIRCDTADRARDTIQPGQELRVRFIEPDGHEVRVKPLGSSLLQVQMVRGGSPEPSKVVAAIDDFAVVRIPLEDLAVTSGQHVHFRVELLEDRASLDHVPSEGLIELTVPAEDFDLRNWQV